MAQFTDLIYGYQAKVPTHHGLKRYINLDNAASTPPFKGVIDLIIEEAEWYSSVHRGSGYKSRYSTDKYEEARDIIARFCGADPQYQTVVFTKNSTDSLNKISHYLPVLPGELVIFTRMEHHSNELPWRVGPHLCLGLRKGRIDLDELESILKKNQGKVKLVAVSGASNVTGYTPPIDIIAELAHRAGARIVVDAAQLIAHRPVNVLSVDHIRHLDFLAFSGHKMYAPFGSGVLIAPKSIFNTIPPSQVGGGTVKGIGPAGVIWATPPEVEEAGSPNVLGALTMARAAQILTGIGWSNLIRHETELLTFILSSLKKIPGVILYNEDPQDRVGVISFNLQRLHHQSVADYLAGWGIGVRSGCFCARGFVQDLLREKGDDPNESLKSGLNPGLVRVSMGCYNQMEELEVFIEVVKELSRMK